MIPFPEEEKLKSNLLLQASVLRATGQDQLAADRFAEAAAMEEKLAVRADADGEPLRAARSHFSAASAWASAGDLYHALELLESFGLRKDVPEALRDRARVFAGKLRAERRQWQHTLQEASLN